MAFVRTAKTNEITPGTIREFQVEGKAVALANVGGKYYAINNTCLHRGGPLGQAVMNGVVVTCPWHGWQYDVTTGKVKQNPAAGGDSYTAELLLDLPRGDVGLPAVPGAGHHHSV